MWSSPDGSSLEDHTLCNADYMHSLLNPEVRRSKKVIFMPRTSSSNDSVNTNTTGYISEAEQAV